MSKIYAMACVVFDREKKILLLKRALDKKFFPGKWAVVAAAPLEKNTDMEKIALREIKDELGVEGQIIKRGKEIIKKLGNTTWVITPLAAVIGSKEIVLNKEHTEARWVTIDSLDSYDLVPGISQAIKKNL